MFLHYLKIAFRNLWKYKLQTIISVIGLAVGFVFFAVSLLWIRYERSYDDFHDDSDRMFIVRQSLLDKLDYPAGISHFTQYPLAGYLKQNFPEVEEACNTMAWKTLIKVNEMTHEVFQTRIDSLFMKIFQIETLKGTSNFLLPESNEIALSEELSTILFGQSDPIGKTVSIVGRDRIVGAIFKNRSKHTNFPFQLLEYNYPVNTWRMSGFQTFVILKKGVDKDAFTKKIFELKIEPEDNLVITNLMLTLLTTLRYNSPSIDADIGVAYKYIFLFTWIGSLVIICALLNYITLFVSRLRMRLKEFSLRMVCGASGLSLFIQLITEFALILFAALLLGTVFIQQIFIYFQQYSNVYLNMSEVFRESLLYVCGVILITIIIFAILLVVFNRQTLNVSIKNNNQKTLRKLSIILQIMISVGFIFCTVVMMKQIHTLHQADIGIDYKNKALIETFPRANKEALVSQLQQIPEITEIVNIYPLIPRSVLFETTITACDDIPLDQTENIDLICASEDYLKYYNVRLLSGELLTDDDDPENILITESGANILRLNQPVGKTITLEQMPYLNFNKTVLRIKGVVKDIHITSPIVKPNPAIFIHEDQVDYFRNYKSGSISITYREGQYAGCKDKIETLIKQMYPNTILRLTNVEDKYNEYFKSETTLLKLVSFVSTVCIIISVFGFISLVTLTCRERQKEIAIRKVYGASVDNILLMYFKEYFLLLIIGAAIAFPAAHFIMLRWLEQYVKQTNIPVWIYFSIICVMALIIVLCVGWRVYQSSIENPAEVVKAE